MRAMSVASRAGAMASEFAGGAVGLLVEYAGDFLVDDASGLVGVVAGVDEVFTQEHGAVGAPGDVA